MEKRWFFGSQRGLVLLVGCLLLGYWLRLIQIDAFSFWTDEGLTPVRSGYPLLQILRNQIVIQDVVTIDTHPPLFYLIISATRRLFGETDFAFRYPSVLASVLLIALLYRFGKRLYAPVLGVTSVLLTTINPLHIWYANETRMYAIFVLLMAAASYALWQGMKLSIVNCQLSIVNGKPPVPNPQPPIPSPRSPIPKYLIAYFIFAALSLYTVYTAVFIIAAQSLFWVWIFWRRGQKRLIWGTAVLGILAAIPLLPVVVPRLLSGVEANFNLVSPAIMLQDVFRFFFLGRSFTFGEGWIRFFMVVALILVAFGTWAARHNATRLFLLAYLFATVLGLMLGSYIFKPMYQGVRHIMVSSPAFLLLAAWGFVWLWESGDWGSGIGDRGSGIGDRGSGIGDRSVFSKQFSSFILHPSSLLFTFYFLLFTFLIGTGHSLNNYYRNGDIAKDNFRGAIGFVESVAGPKDVVVYNNAILLPLHEHYQTRTDTAVTASPIYPTRAGTPQNIDQLQTLAATYDRIWLITDPPADKRDEQKFVQGWLDENLALIDVFPFHARTTNLNVRAYRGVAVGDGLPETAVSTQTTWESAPGLVGVDITPPSPTANSAWVDLYWQELTAADASSQLRMALVAPDQREWAVQNVRLYTVVGEPNWERGELIRTTHRFQLPVGLPSGVYKLTIQPVDEAGNGVETAVSPITVTLAQPVPAPYRRPLVQFENGVAFHQLALADTVVLPGQNLPFALYWSASDGVMSSETVYQLNVLDENGTPLREDLNQLGPDWQTVWGEGAVRENGGFYIRPEAAVGTYTVELLLQEEGEGVNGRFRNRLWPQESFTVGQFSVEPWPLNSDMLPFDAALDAQFGDGIILKGYTLEQSSDALMLDLVWQTIAAPSDNYLIFIHLVDEAGNIVQQIDQVPVGGLRPTAGWRPTEVLLDSYQMPLLLDLPAGRYELRLGFSQPETFARLPVTVDNTPQPNDQLLLEIIEIR